MNTRPILHSLILALALLVLTTASALAWPDAPFAKIEITGPAINGVATITGDLLSGMTIQNFMGGDTIEKPARLGPVTELHRYFTHEDGTLWDFDRVRYYADPDGGRGYVEYVEGIGYSPWNNGHWFRATAAADATMVSILASLNPAPLQPQPQPALLPASNQNWLTVLLLAALGGAFIVATSVVTMRAQAGKG